MKKDIDFELLVRLHSKGMNDYEIGRIMNLDGTTVKKYREHLNIPKNIYRRKISEEQKKLISKKRKDWLKNNPDKHPWRNKDKFQSKPCSKVKQFLSNKNILFVEEFNPNIPDRFFSIDIALPDKKIALEINGNQHYDRDGKLKTYYQERHDLLVSYGWTVFEIHYSHCFDIEKWDNFSDIILEKNKEFEFDYFNYVPKIKTKSLKIKEQNKKIKPLIIKNKKTIQNYCKCGSPIRTEAKNCVACNGIKNRKVKNRPSVTELKNLLAKYSMVEIGKLYGVSDNAVRKWLKPEKVIQKPD